PDALRRSREGCSELQTGAQSVEAAPPLGHLSVGDSVDGDTGQSDLLAGRGVGPERTQMSARQRPPGRCLVAGDYQIVDCATEIRERRHKVGAALPERLAALKDAARLTEGRVGGHDLVAAGVVQVAEQVVIATDDSGSFRGGHLRSSLQSSNLS